MILEICFLFLVLIILFILRDKQKSEEIFRKNKEMHMKIAQKEGRTCNMDCKIILDGHDLGYRDRCYGDKYGN